MVILTARSSTIFVGTDECTRVFSTIEEVPIPLRKKLVASTQGANSATIFIADKRGRQELVRALEGRKSSVQCRLAQAMRAKKERFKAPQHSQSRFRSLRTWLEFLLPVAIGASIWLVIDSHF